MLTNHFGLRVGFGYVGLGTGAHDNGDGTTSEVNVSLTAIPAILSWYPFSDVGPVPSSKFEIGAGIVYFGVSASTTDAKVSASGVAIAGVAGYRYQPADGGFLFRLSFTPYLLHGTFKAWEDFLSASASKLSYRIRFEWAVCIAKCAMLTASSLPKRDSPARRTDSSFRLFERWQFPALNISHKIP